MSKLDEKLAEGRALRKAARAVVETDLALLRSEWAPGPLAGRVASRTREKGAELSAQATDWGRRHGPAQGSRVGRPGARRRTARPGAPG